jgi:spermidine/putrescine transport system permease protein
MAGTAVGERTETRSAPRAARSVRPPLGLLAAAAATFAFIYAPIAVLVAFSFGERRIPTWPLQGFTVTWYRELLGSEEIRTALRNSVVVATAATTGALLLGTPIAYAAHRFRFPGKRLLRRLVLMPLVVPGVVTGIALLTLFDFFHVTLSLGTIMVGHVTFLIAVFFTSVFARLEALGTQIERAAMDLGATEWRAFTRAVLPNLRLTLIGASLLAFALSFDEIAVTFFLTGTSNTVPVLIYSMMRLGITPTINALATSILAVSVALVAAASVLLAHGPRKVSGTHLSFEQ